MSPTRLDHGWMSLSAIDRKSTRLNSSHDQISYAVFCLKKKKTAEHTFDSVDVDDHVMTHLQSHGKRCALVITLEPSLRTYNPELFNKTGLRPRDDDCTI